VPLFCHWQVGCHLLYPCVLCSCKLASLSCVHTAEPNACSFHWICTRRYCVFFFYLVCWLHLLHLLSRKKRKKLPGLLDYSVTSLLFHSCCASSQNHGRLTLKSWVQSTPLISAWNILGRHHFHFMLTCPAMVGVGIASKLATVYVCCLQQCSIIWSVCLSLSSCVALF
jgi:hypothetical protein